MVLAVFEAPTGGKPIPSSVGGGGDSNDLRWDGRDPKEDEESFRHRALMHALKLVCHGGQKKNRGFHRLNNPHTLSLYNGVCGCIRLSQLFVFILYLPMISGMCNLQKRIIGTKSNTMIIEKTISIKDAVLKK